MSAIIQSNQVIDLKFLQTLIDNGVSEGRTVDYKSQLFVDTRDQKVEFCADVSSFANTTGGSLYIGIEEQAGLPTELVGIEVADVDELKLKLEQILLNGVQPRLIGVQVEAVSIKDDKYVFIVTVPRSWAQPHRVTLGGHAKFYARNSAGKYDLDVNDLRNAFLSTNTLNEQLREFRRDRINIILANDTPTQLLGGPKVVLHIVPLANFESRSVIDIRNLESTYISPMDSSRDGSRYNIDGYFVDGHKTDGASKGYVQIFRNGVIESVASGWTTEYQGTLFIASQRFEECILDSFKKYLQLQIGLGLNPPFYVTLSLLNMKGYRMAVPSSYFEYPEPIDRDIILTPELVLETTEFEADIFLKPMFDAVWNASGWPHSIYYDDAGRWNRR